MTSKQEKAWENLSTIVAEIEKTTDLKDAWEKVDLLLTTLGVTLSSDQPKIAALVAYTLTCYASTHYSFLMGDTSAEDASKGKALLLTALENSTKTLEEDEEEEKKTNVINTFGRTIMRSG